MCARARVRACGRARMRAYMRACGRACACAHTCACAYPRVYVRRRVRMGVVAWALWFDGFCGGYGGFDTPRNASGCNGFKLSGLSGLTFPIGNTYDGANKTNEH